MLRKKSEHIFLIIAYFLFLCVGSVNATTSTKEGNVKNVVLDADGDLLVELMEAADTSTTCEYEYLGIGYTYVYQPSSASEDKIMRSWLSMLRVSAEGAFDHNVDLEVDSNNPADHTLKSVIKFTYVDIDDIATASDCSQGGGSPDKGYMAVIEEVELFHYREEN